MADPIRSTQHRSDQRVESKQSFLLFAVLAAICAALWPVPELLRERSVPGHETAVPETVPGVSVASEGKPAELPAVSPETLKHEALAEFLAKRYRVSKDALADFILHAHSAAQLTKIDPLLILAVMAVESRFNPVAESVMGAKGLMQIIPQYHAEKFVKRNGAADVLDPETNILAGARVLREYAAKSGNDLVAALRMYGGAVSDSENVYANKVLSERDRLAQVLRSIPVRATPVPARVARGDGVI